MAERINIYNYLKELECDNCKTIIPFLNEKGEWRCVCCGFFFEKKEMRGQFGGEFSKKKDWVPPKKEWCKYCRKSSSSKQKEIKIKDKISWQ